MVSLERGRRKKRLHSEELHSSYFSTNVRRLITLHMMFVHRRMGEVTEGVKINSELVITLGKLRRRLDDNIKLDLKILVCGLDQVAKDIIQWWTF